MKHPDLDPTPEYQRRRLCSFGITEALIAAGVGAGLGETAAGVLAGGLVTGAEGAGIGALTSGITGGDPLKGAEFGGLTGAGIGAFGPAIGAATGLGTTAGDVLAGTAAGAGAGALTGEGPLRGALGGAAGGLGAGLTAGAPGTAGTTPSTPATGAVSAAGAGGSTAAETAAATQAATGLALDPAAAPGGTAPVTAVETTALSPLGGAGSAGGGTVATGADAMFGGLTNPYPAGFYLPTGTAAAPQYGPDAFTATGFTPVAGGFSAGPIDTTGGGFWSTLGANALGLIQQNPGLLLSSGLLASQLFRGNQQYPAEQQLQQVAGEAGSQGRALSAYVQSGTLPPGAEQAVRLAEEADKARQTSLFTQAVGGRSSAEASALGTAGREAAAQRDMLARQLLQQGINLTTLSGEDYARLLDAQQRTDEEFQRSLLQFATGLGGARSGGGTTA